MRYLTVVLFVSLWWCQASATDPAIAWSAGGIRIPIEKGISIEKKDLFISPAAVKVKYVLRNTTPKPIQATIAFKVPAHPHKSLGSQSYWDEEIIQANLYNHDRASSWTLDRPERSKTPFMNFFVRVNGKEATVNRIVEATKGSQNVTAILKEHNLPLSPDVATCSNLPLINFDKNECRKHLEALRELKLIDERDQPLWQKSIRFEWQQDFPANEDVMIEYSYRPATGFISVHFDDERPPLESLSIGLLHTGCFLTNACFHDKMGLEKDLIGWLLTKFAQDLQAPDQNRGTYLYEVGYLLNSDALSTDPIKSFSLVLEHPEGGTVQVCPLWPDMTLKRTSSTQVQASRTNFVPKADLAVFFTSPTLLKDVF